MSEDKDERTRAIEAFDILNDFIGDCVTPVNVFQYFLIKWKGDEERKQSLNAVFRLCASQAILTLYKWVEFYKKYHSLIPEELKTETKLLLKRIEAREIEEFRNSHIGHIWNKTENRPLYNSEIDKLLRRITLGHAGNFMMWIHNSEDNSYPKTVVSIIMKLRDLIGQNYSIDFKDDVLEN